MAFSTDEVKTPETWLNGEDIYERTFVLSNTNTGATQLDIEDSWSIIEWTCVEVTAGGDVYVRRGELRPDQFWYQFYGSVSAETTYVYCKYVKGALE